MQVYRWGGASSKGTRSSNSCTILFVELSGVQGYSQTWEAEQSRNALCFVLWQADIGVWVFLSEDPRVHCLPPQIHRNQQRDSEALGLSKLCIGWNNFLVLIELLFISSAISVIQANLELSCFFSVYFGLMLLRCPWVLAGEHSVQGVKGTLRCSLVAALVLRNIL